jgi:hypothetical protein
MKNTRLRLVLVLAIALTLFSSIRESALVGILSSPSHQAEGSSYSDFDVPVLVPRRSDYYSRLNNSTVIDVDVQTINNNSTVPDYVSANSKSNSVNTTSTATATTTTTTTTTTNLSICFLTSVYAKWAAHADKLQNVTHFAAEGDFYFFVYTNLPRLKAKGWTRIVKTHTQYNRFITQSRWPKFLAWQDPNIALLGGSSKGGGGDDDDNGAGAAGGCQVVFYLDSIGHLIGTPNEFRKMAQEIFDSPVGLAQYEHRGGGGAFGEFRRIEVFKKDLDSNIRASKRWLSEQPDFRPTNCTLYENRYFGYRIDSVAFRRAATFLWDHYSLEQDSWRDQPLWCYVLDHFNITPIPLRHKELFKLSTGRMGKAKHRYDATAEGDAKTARQERGGGGGGTRNE